MTWSIAEILTYLDSQGFEYHFEGDPGQPIEGFSSLAHYRPGTITWIKKAENLTGHDDTCVTLAVMGEGIRGNVQNAIITKESKAVFFSILDHFLDPAPKAETVGEGSYIGPQVTLGKNVRIGKNCVLDGEIDIGDDTVLANGVVMVNRVHIGKRCMVQSLSVLGEDGFGYFERPDGIREMVRHHGGVRVGDDVFIGSHVNIARGTIDDTVIGNNVKIAPFTHIGHNNRIEDDATIICSRLFGSCQIGRDAYLTSCTIRNQSTVGEYALVGMGAVVTQDVPAGKVVVGIPAEPIRDREKNDV